MFEPEVLRKEIYCPEESTCEIVGNFRRSQQTFGAHRSDLATHNDPAPGKLCPPCPPVVTPLSNTDNIAFHRRFAMSGGLTLLRAFCQWKIEPQLN